MITKSTSLLVVAVFGGAMSITGCSSPPSDCDAPETIGDTIVIQDVTEIGASVQFAEVACIMQATLERGDAVTVIAADGTPRITALEVRADVEGKNSVAAEHEVEKASQQLRASFAPADTDGLDLVRAVMLATDLADGVPTTIVVVSSGLSDTTPLRFQDEGTIDADPAEMANFLVDHELVARMRGTDVVWIGAGYPADGTLLTPGQQRSVRDIWEAVLTGSGAGAVTFVATPPVGAAISTPFEVAAPWLDTPARPDFGVDLVYRQGSALGFVPDRAEFLDPKGARAELAALADLMRDYPDAKVSILGTTAYAKGIDQQSSQDLAERRARAAKAILVELGIDGARIEVSGLAGKDSPFYVDNYGSDGRFLVREAALNRALHITAN